MSHITIRPAVLSDMIAVAKVRINSWRVAYKGIVSDEFLQAMSLEKSTQNFTRDFVNEGNPTFYLVAEDDVEGVVGFSTCGINREVDYAYQGEIYGLYLLESYWRKGIGKKLACYSAMWLHDCNLTNFVIRVLRENTATHFYQAIGGKLIDEGNVMIASQQLPIQIYGWDNNAVAPLLQHFEQEIRPDTEHIKWYKENR